MKIAANAGVGTYPFQLGAHCSNPKVNCYPASVSLIVKPKINCASASKVCPNLWFFNVAAPPQLANYNPDLQSTPAGETDYTWTITNGTKYAQFSNKSATIDTKGVNNVEIYPNSTDPGTGAPPTVTVTVTVKGKAGTVTSDPFTLNLRRPAKLSPHGITDKADAAYGYESDMHYQVLDQTGAVMPFPLPLNGHFTSGLVNDFHGADWRFPDNCGSTHVCGNNYSPSDWYDLVQGEGSTFKPTPQHPQTPLGTTKVDHRVGTWGIGDPHPGKGVQVQTNTWQKWRDHGRHTNITSP